MAENLLILTPKSYDVAPAHDAVLNMLQGERFIADTIEINGAQHFRPGEEFMMLITFLGCSPMIATGEIDSDGEQYCHIAIEGPLEKPLSITGDNIKIPRCPKCGHRHDNWQEILKAWQEDPQQSFSCPECGEDYNAIQLRWRKCAGFGRFFIKVWGIFESEAVPSPNLLSSLQKATGVEWQHFYVRHN